MSFRELSSLTSPTSLVNCLHPEQLPCTRLEQEHTFFLPPRCIRDGASKASALRTLAKAAEEADDTGIAAGISAAEVAASSPAASSVTAISMFPDSAFGILLAGFCRSPAGCSSRRLVKSSPNSTLADSASITGTPSTWTLYVSSSPYSWGRVAN